MTRPGGRAKRPDLPMLTSLQSLLLERAARSPDAPALAWYDTREVVEWQSYSSLHGDAQAIADRLRALGLRRGEVCVIVLPSSEPSARVLLAAFHAGAIPLLVAPPTLQHFNSDLAAILFRTIERSSARLVVYGEALGDSEVEWSRLERKARFVPVDRLLGPPAAARPSTVPRSRGATGMAAMQLTSGTTTMPRIGMWDHRAVAAALQGMASAMRLSADDVCFNWTPLYHDMGLVNNFLLCLTRGVPLVMMKPQDFVRRPVLWLRGLHAAGATITWSPNFGFSLAAERVAERDLKGIRLDHVRTFWNAAERVHLDSIRKFEHRFAKIGVRPGSVKTNFGCVENVGGATFSDLDAAVTVEHLDRDQLHQGGVAIKVAAGGVPIVSVGRPYPGMKCFVLGRHGRQLPDGHVGEIAFLTPSRMLGYRSDARATRRALFGKYLRTGDLGYLRDGELFWVGRVRERITVRGKKLDPSDFESLLFEIGGLRTGCFAAFGVDDDKLGTQRIVVVAEVKEPLERRPEDVRGEIIERTYRELDVSVSEVVLVRGGALAKTSSGKRRHRRFRELYLDGTLARFAIQMAGRARR